MRIGLISDTHDLLRPEVFDVFAGVDHIIHAGDVGSPDILVSLRAIAPVTAVVGNTDSWQLANELPQVATVEIGGLNVTVLHGHRLGRPNAERVADTYPDADLVVFGHSHQPEILRRGRTLIVNPGSAGPARFSLPVTLAIVEVGPAGVTAELVQLAHGRGRSG